MQYPADYRIKDMTPMGNTDSRYGVVAMSLHWIMALALVVLMGVGVYMVRLPDVGFDTTKIRLILYHKELGILVLTLACVRLGWRATHALPRLVENFPDWQKIIARFVSLCFYALMFALPLTGWLMSSAAGIPVSFFGLFLLPDLIHRSDDLFHGLVAIHHALGFTMIALLLVHAGAALRHHFVLRDDTLRNMLPAEATAFNARASEPSPPLPSARAP